MRRILILLGGSLAVVALSMTPVVAAPGNDASTGKTTVDTTVDWQIGDGQFDGEFITAEVRGVEIGLRAQERFVGPLDVTGDQGNRVGVYQAETGTTGGNNGTWNYDWHVDVSGGQGNASGRTLTDYSLTLEQDFSDEDLFEELGSDPVMLPMPDVCDGASDTVCQQSWNPGFGNDDYEPADEGDYHLRLVLTPETFNGPSLAVAIRVEVTAPAA